MTAYSAECRMQRRQVFTQGALQARRAHAARALVPSPETPSSLTATALWRVANDASGWPKKTTVTYESEAVSPKHCAHWTIPSSGSREQHRLKECLVSLQTATGATLARSARVHMGCGSQGRPGTRRWYERACRAVAAASAVSCSDLPTPQRTLIQPSTPASARSPARSAGRAPNISWQRRQSALPLTKGIAI
jgi:hypothetical protein